MVMHALLDALAFMHTRGVIHRDLKLENLVLANPGDIGSVTILDFGLAKALQARERSENVCGTLAYVSPEALVAGIYGQGVDVWALGVAMHALLTARAPARGSTRRVMSTHTHTHTIIVITPTALYAAGTWPFDSEDDDELMDLIIEAEVDLEGEAEVEEEVVV